MSAISKTMVAALAGTRGGQSRPAARPARPSMRSPLPGAGPPMTPAGPFGQRGSGSVDELVRRNLHRAGSGMAAEDDLVE
jgi:hypothetical protein